MEKPELLLKKLRRLESNMRCPNCGTPAQPGIGFGNVCVKFKTFVCDLCKTSHQAISHRVKSYSMSTWTMEEVMELTAERHGGNQVALHVWLGNAPGFGERYPGGFRPKEGDKVETFKQFITDCYERGKFKSSTPFDASSVVSDIEHATPQKKRSEERVPVSSVQQSHQRPIHAPPAPKAPIAPSFSAELDLLAFDSPAEGASCPTGFGSFDSCPTQQIDFFAAAPEPSTISNGGSSDFIDFGDFSSSLPPQSSMPLNPISSATSSSGAISLQSYGSAPPLHNNGNNSFVDPFSSPMVSSVSMPNFPTMNQQPTIGSSAQVNSTQNRTKSNLDLASLYDQPAKPSASSSIISSLSNLNLNNNGSSINNMMHPSQMNSSSGTSQTNRPMGQNNVMMGAQNSAMANNNVYGGMQSMNGNMQSMTNGSMNGMNGNMNGNMQSMNGNMNGNVMSMSGNMNGNTNGHMNGNTNGHMNGNMNGNMNGSAMSMNGGQMINGHGQSSAQSYSNTNYSSQQPQQLQQQQSYANHTQQQQPYRGMVTPGSAPKKPSDAFDFVGSSMSAYSAAPAGRR